MNASATVWMPVQRRSRERARRVGVAAGERDHAHVAVRLLDEQDRAVGGGRLEQRRAVSRPSRSGSAAASTIRRTIASSASAGEMTYSPVPPFASSDSASARVGEVAFGAELLEDGQGRGADGARPPSARRFPPRAVRGRDGSAPPDSARRADRAAWRFARCRDRRRPRGRSRACSAPRRRRYSPHAAGATFGSSAPAAVFRRCLGARAIVRRGQRFGGNQRRLQRVERAARRPGGSRRRATRLRRAPRA